MRQARRPILFWLLLVVGSVATIVLVLIVVQAAPRGDLRQRTEARLKAHTVPMPGVVARLTSGQTTIERTLPAMAFAVAPDQSLDARIPAGPFEGRFTATFKRGTVRQAYIGARIRGGSLIISRNGEVVLSDYADEEPRLVMTPQPLSLGRATQQFIYEFRSEGTTDAALRAMWQPVSSDVPLPLLCQGAPVVDRQEIRGFVLAQEFGCVRCHRSSNPAMQQRLEANQAPLLGDVGARVRPSWLRRWIAYPAAVKGNVHMPRLFGEQPADVEQIEDLVHFLVSMGGPIDLASPGPDPALVATGDATYHAVGCMACHGPLDDPTANASGGYTAMGPVSQKTTVEQLASFLLDPLRTRPSGRMPSCRLEPLEAEAVAGFLIGRGPPPDSEADAAFTLEPERARRGRKFFASTGCANCHELGPDQPSISSVVSEQPLEALSAVSETGCLAQVPPPSAPVFDLRPHERRALSAFLRSLPGRRCDNVPIDDLTVVLERLDCAACHAFHSKAGPSAELRPYFRSQIETDLGDEGRLPPDLTDVGAKLNRTWISAVLEEEGLARPYLATRMPQFGQRNVAAVPDLLAAAAGIGPDQPVEPTCDPAMASIGRRLVGSGAFNCIQCHSIAGHEATSTPGPDLAHMVERLRYDNFVRWVQNPSMVRPGTRMPSFFVAGRSGFTNMLHGNAADQIDAIWCYLAQGESLPLPEGLLNPGGLALEVANEPLVFRTYMDGAGVRAVACGFPEQIHCAFDAERCMPALIWQGQFLNAQGAWAARGGSETNPPEPVWSAPDVPLEDRRFRGYRLDAERRPIFCYEVMVDGRAIVVEEQPVPVRSADGPGLRRRFWVRGEPAAHLVVPSLGFQVVQASTPWEQLDDQRIQITLDEHGESNFDLELNW